MASLYSLGFTKLESAPLGLGELYKKRCDCVFCSMDHNASFPCCSKECLGTDESNLVAVPRHARYVLNESAHRRCSHIHSKCQVPDCNASREQYMTDQKTREFLGFDGPCRPQPFCENHLPKCACGNWCYTKSSAFTEMKYPLSEADSASFSRYCMKCSTICTITDCKSMVFISCDKKSSFCEDHERQFVVKGHEKFEQLVRDAASIRTNPEFQPFKEKVLFPGRYTFEEYFLTCTSLFTQASTSANPTIWQNFFKEADYFHRYSEALSEEL
ncbi:MAG: hypothetical protein Hyperionvirus2_216 [Hyperionvirus sp.]|uniref:Uncharacterized protein n=1 Tax=Hyperionvirus sp. TaxID=2487770 RepID=A0A3G5A6P4_9VIRU|nr:MAG: hypothetical protein Hyperionvirus2_216 [Hyperionvirus sp.]